MNSDYTTVALVTGATSGIGRAIACRLLSEGMTVFGIGRNAAGAPQDPHFQLLTVDLTDLRAVEVAVRNIDAPVSLLVNAAGVAYYGPHETLSPTQIAEMVAVNVTAPLALCNLLLPKLRDIRRHPRAKTLTAPVCPRTVKICDRPAFRRIPVRTQALTGPAPGAQPLLDDLRIQCKYTQHFPGPLPKP